MHPKNKLNEFSISIIFVMCMGVEFMDLIHIAGGEFIYCTLLKNDSTQ